MNADKTMPLHMRLDDMNVMRAVGQIDDDPEKVQLDAMPNLTDNPNVLLLGHKHKRAASKVVALSSYEYIENAEVTHTTYEYTSVSALGQRFATKASLTVRTRCANEQRTFVIHYEAIEDAVSDLQMVINAMK